MSISDEALTAYYEVRSRAEQRYEASASKAEQIPDPLQAEIELQGQQIYQERLGDLAGLTIGEVGVGSGDFVRHAYDQRARELVLIDISSERLKALGEEFRAASGEISTKLIVADARNLDGVDDGELDLLVAKEVIEHLPDYRPFLRECHRVLRPGGRLYLTTPNRHCVDLWPRRLFGRVVPENKRRGQDLIRSVFGHLYEFVTNDEAQHLADVLPAGFKEHIHEFAPRELTDALAAHGLRVIRHWGTPPQMFRHELRPFARTLLGPWNRAENTSYVLGDDLRVIAERIA